MSTTVLYVIGGVAVAVVLWIIAVYNGLIKSKNRVQEGWSDIDVQLKRRYNLIPNLVETVKGYAKHEDKVLTAVTEARNKAMGQTGSPNERAGAENMLSSTLKSLFAVSESYPDLKANENFAKLQDELTDTENKIQSSRRFYNGMVRDFNTKLQVFPTNMIGKRLGFKDADFFEAGSEEERKNVKVKF
jgi:LemA protein